MWYVRAATVRPMLVAVRSGSEYPLTPVSGSRGAVGGAAGGGEGKLANNSYCYTLFRKLLAV